MHWSPAITNALNEHDTSLVRLGGRWLRAYRKARATPTLPGRTRRSNGSCVCVTPDGGVGAVDLGTT